MSYSGFLPRRLVETLRNGSSSNLREDLVDQPYVDWSNFDWETFHAETDLAMQSLDRIENGEGPMKMNSQMQNMYEPEEVECEDEEADEPSGEDKQTRDQIDRMSVITRKLSINREANGDLTLDLTGYDRNALYSPGLDSRVMEVQDKLGQSALGEQVGQQQAGNLLEDLFKSSDSKLANSICLYGLQLDAFSELVTRMTKKSAIKGSDGLCLMRFSVAHGIEKFSDLLIGQVRKAVRISNTGSRYVPEVGHQRVNHDDRQPRATKAIKTSPGGYAGNPEFSSSPSTKLSPRVSFGEESQNSPCSDSELPSQPAVGANQPPVPDKKAREETAENHNKTSITCSHQI